MKHPPIPPIAGFSGHLRDLAAIAAFRFHHARGYTKFRQIVSTARQCQATTLIETGTFRGVTTRRCLGYFDRVVTIELDEKLAAAAQQRLGRHGNCEVIQGDASDTVKQLLDRRDLGDRLLFFLDGHFSGGVTALGSEPEPALNILETIVRHSDRVAGVIVDDFREFGAHPGWPTKGELVMLAERLFCTRGFRMSIHLDQLILSRPHTAAAAA